MDIKVITLGTMNGNKLPRIRNIFTFAALKRGTIAQLVEQRTENPCVAGSTPAGTTKE